MMDKYVVERNWCDCHPETCCCNPWKIVNSETGETFTTAFSKSKADSMAETLNGDCK